MAQHTLYDSGIVTPARAKALAAALRKSLPAGTSKKVAVAVYDGRTPAGRKVKRARVVVTA